MSEEKTMYDDAHRRGAKRTMLEVFDAAPETTQPREVEYEWRVVHAATGNAISSFGSEQTARSYANQMRINYASTYRIERRPVGEWERVDG
jgi:hypothetical protein